MKSEWKKLNEVAEFISRGITPAYVESDGLCVLNQKCVRNGVVSLTPARLHNVVKKKVAQDKYLRHWDILVNSTGTGTLGRVAQVVEDIFPCTVDSHITIVRPSKIIDPSFLGYVMIWNQPNIEGLAQGSTGQTELSKQRLGEEIKIPFPPLETQRKIAAILSALDDKIELNRRINANLSAQLETVYRGRFAADDMKRGGSLADICRYSAERVAVEELALDRYYSTENMAPEKAGALAAATLPAVANVVKCRAGDVLVSNIRPYFKKILYCQTDCGCSPDVLCFTPQTPELSAFLFATLYADEFFEFMVAGSKGTKMPRGDKKQIMTYPVAIPTVDELNEFNKLATPLLTEIENNRLENIALAAVRDAALPRLMSGEIDVSDVSL